MDPRDLPDSARQAPHSLDAEQSVLGGILLDNSAMDRVADVLTERDFYSGQHRILWRGMVRMLESGKGVDILTLDNFLKDTKDRDEYGGFAYLGALAQAIPSAHNIRHYAEIVHEKWVRRELLRVSVEIGDMAFNPSGREASALLDDAETKVMGIAEAGRTKQDLVELRPLLTAAVERIDTMFHREDKNAITGIASGFVDLDEKTNGFQETDLIILAARPSMGKTSLALNIAEHVAIEARLPVAVFSMEMAGIQLAMRMLGSRGRLNHHAVSAGRLNDDDWNRLTNAVGQLHDVPIHVDESPALSAMELRAKARRLHRQYGRLGMVVIDYLQLMQGAGEENRGQQIAGVSRSLKALAKELRCPVVALSQLNRGLEQRPNKRPVMSDLRESGAIEQDADLILFIYRDEVYNPDGAERGLAEVIIGKQRSGPTGTVKLTFLSQYTKFENYAAGGM